MARRKRTTFVVIVDDDAGLRAAIEDLLNSNGFRARSFPSAEAFLQCAGGAEVGCLISGLSAPRNEWAGVAA
jgi:two-component system response regulator FixJ